MNLVTVPMQAARFQPAHTVLKETALRGAPALRVTKGEEKRMQFDENPFALARGGTFHNGVMEAEFCSRLLPDAPDFARGCQNFACPGYTFADFRAFGIGGYEAPVDAGLGETVHLRAEIRGRRPRFTSTTRRSRCSGGTGSCTARTPRAAWGSLWRSARRDSSGASPSGPRTEKGDAAWQATQKRR